MVKGLARRRDDTKLIIGCSLAVGAVLFLLAFGIDRVNFNVLAGMMTAIVIVLATIPMLRWVARKEGDPWLGRILVWALFAKLAFSMVRYFVIEVVYNGNADAGLYGWAGEVLAQHWMDGNFTTQIPYLANRGPETVRVALIVALIYLITGFSIYAAFFVFATISFWGQVLMVRAMRKAVPGADHRHYTILVMFLPSLLFWPSSVGKEAVMIGCIGVASYGAANILGERGRLRGYLTFALGVVALFLFRPHMGMIAIVSLGVASAVGVITGFRQYDSTKAFAVRFGALVLLIATASLATTQLTQFLAPEDSPDEFGIAAVLERTEEMTSTGDSEFEPPSVNSPLDLPAATVTVLFRPFPWEVDSLTSLLAAAEGLLLLAILVAGWRRTISWVRAAPRYPYLLYAFTFSMVFVIAFSYVSNFGILVRQRTQMLALVLTLVGMYPAARKKMSIFGVPADTPAEEKRPEYQHAADGRGGEESREPEAVPLAKATCHDDGGRTSWADGLPLHTSPFR